MATGMEALEKRLAVIHASTRYGIGSPEYSAANTAAQQATASLSPQEQLIYGQLLKSYLEEVVGVTPTLSPAVIGRRAAERAKKSLGQL